MNIHSSRDVIQDHDDNASLEIPITVSEPQESTTIIFTSYDENQISPFMRSLCVLKKGIKAIVLFTNRLWIAYTIMIGVSVFIKRISHNFGGDVSPSLGYQITARHDETPVYVTDGIPALFGKILDQPIQTKLIHIDITTTDFCRSYSKGTIFNQTNETFALVPRGGCLFERKVQFIQEAGFAGAIIYNALNTPTKDYPIRMSSYFSASNITITCMYLTYRSHLRLKPYLNRDLIISPHDWYFIPTGSSAKQVAIEFLEFTIQLWKFSISFLLFCFVLLLGYNLITKRRLEILETMQSCTDFLLNEGSSYPVPKLISIPFPKRILGLDDIASMSNTNHNIRNSKKYYNNPCCAICIDDFSVNDIVRDLPCGHIYHCAW